MKKENAFDFQLTVCTYNVQLDEKEGKCIIIDCFEIYVSITTCKTFIILLCAEQKVTKLDSIE